MITSEFQFSNPILTGLEYKMNMNFDIDVPKVNIPMSTKCSVSKVNDKCEAIVELKVQVGTMENESPFIISVVEEAVFKWDRTLKDEAVDNLLSQNAPALLLAYIRPIVSNITAASPYPAYNIPFMNFTK